MAKGRKIFWAFVLIGIVVIIYFTMLQPEAEEETIPSEERKPAEEKGDLYIAFQNVNIRSGPSTSNEINPKVKIEFSKEDEEKRYPVTGPS